MSTELLCVASVVDEGVKALRVFYSKGISKRNFAIYSDEFAWLESRISRRKPINRRVFIERFPDFEFMRAKGESIADLALELKEECALAEVNSLIASLAEQADKDNVLELCVAARDTLSQITRAHAPMSDIDLDDWQAVIEDMRHGMLLASQGESMGVLSGINFIDHHMGGLMPGQFIEILGRTGQGKSYFVTIPGWTARKAGHNVGIFSPELNDHEVRCRYHTLASADKDVQKALGLERSFRNRALMQRQGFNLKSYQAFCEYIRAMPGRMHMLSGRGMSEQMSVGYIEDRIVEYELDLVIVDPIYLLKPVRLHAESNVYQEVAWIAEALHRIGEQYNVPILFTNQAHLDGNQGDAPGLDKSFGSKALLHLADYVLAVKHISDENKTIVRSNKSRFGEGFRFEADFYPNTGLFRVTTPLVGNYFNGNDDGATEDDKREYVRTAEKGRASQKGK